MPCSNSSRTRVTIFSQNCFCSALHFFSVRLASHASILAPMSVVCCTVAVGLVWAVVRGVLSAHLGRFFAAFRTSSAETRGMATGLLGQPVASSGLPHNLSTHSSASATSSCGVCVGSPVARVLHAGALVPKAVGSSSRVIARPISAFSSSLFSCPSTAGRTRYTDKKLPTWFFVS